MIRRLSAFARALVAVEPLIFLVIGIVPDAASLRDASTGLRKRWYSLLAFGWRGTDDEWRHYTRAYGLFATLASPVGQEMLRQKATASVQEVAQKELGKVVIEQLLFTNFVLQ